VKIRSVSPGKMILLGEYAVLEGSPALVCAVDRFAEVQLERRGEGPFDVAAPSIGIARTVFTVSDRGIVRFLDTDDQTRKQLGFFRMVFEFVWHYFRSCGKNLPPVSVSIDTGAFYSQALKSKLGFGSSAAMTVALTAALLDVDDAFSSIGEEKRNRIFRLALSAHRKAQGNLGSGVDIAASTFGGVLRYEMGLNQLAEQKIPGQVGIWNTLPMLTVFTGKSESTRKMVRGVSQLKKSHAAAYRQMMTELTDLSEKGYRHYRDQQGELFLETVAAYLDSLKRLGDESGMPIVSPVHLRLVERINALGGVYKPSGAGSGDIGIAFARSADQLQTIAHAIEDEGYATVPVRIAEAGVVSSQE